MNKKILLILMIFVILIGSFYLYLRFFNKLLQNPQSQKYTGSVATIRLGVEVGLLASTVWVAEHNGYFKDQGIDIEIKEFPSGRTALASMLNEGNLDMATVAQTPIVLNSFTRNDYQIIAGMVTSYNDVKILARKDRGISTGNDLKGKKVGITKGSTGNYFLNLFLAQHNLALNDVMIVDFETSALQQAIIAGKVDAISTWEPHIYKSKNELGTKALQLESKGVFREDFYFTVFRDWAKNNPELIKRFLLAINSAETFIMEHPTESQQIVAKRLNLDPALVTSVWNDYNFHLFLDQAILLSLEEQSRWMQDQEVVTTDAISNNYLNFIYFDALELVKPEAVSIIYK